MTTRRQLLLRVIAWHVRPRGRHEARDEKGDVPEQRCVQNLGPRSTREMIAVRRITAAAVMACVFSFARDREFAYDSHVYANDELLVRRDTSIVRHRRLDA